MAIEFYFRFVDANRMKYKYSHNHQKKNGSADDTRPHCYYALALVLTLCEKINFVITS